MMNRLLCNGFVVVIVSAAMIGCNAAEGPIGSQGPEGPVGEQGPAGNDGAPGDDGAPGNDGAGGVCADAAPLLIASVQLEEAPLGVYEFGETYTVTVTFDSAPERDVAFTIAGPGGDFGDGFAPVDGSDVAFEAQWTLEAPLYPFDYSVIATDGCTIATGTFDFPGAEEPGLRLKLTVSEDRLPAGGGPVEICWDSQRAESCRVRIEESEYDDFTWSFEGLQGCETVTLPSTTWISGTCLGGTTWARERVNDSRVVYVGPTVVEFGTLNSPVLGWPGEVAFFWETSHADSCELVVNGVGAGVPTNVSWDNPHVVRFDENAQVRLECDAAGTDGARSRTILVVTGAYIVSFDFGEFWQDTLGSLSFTLHYRVLGADYCELEVVNGAYSNSTYISGRALLEQSDLEYELSSYDFTAELRATLSCYNEYEGDGGGGPAVETRVALP